MCAFVDACGWMWQASLWKRLTKKEKKKKEKRKKKKKEIELNSNSFTTHRALIRATKKLCKIIFLFVPSKKISLLIICHAGP